MEQREKKHRRQWNRILVFNNSFYSLSETFVYRQVSLLEKHFDVDLMGFKTESHPQYPRSGHSMLKVTRRRPRLEKLIDVVLRKIFKIRLPYPRKVSALLKKYFADNASVIHAHYGWNGRYLLPIAKRTASQLVVSFHGNDASGWLKKPDYARALPSVLRYASAIVLCSDHMRRTLQIQPEDMAKVHIIPYGIPVADLRPADPLDDGLIRILHAGRLVAKKGVDDLIKAFHILVQEFPNIRLGIVGDGPEREPCIDLIETYKLGHVVTYQGALPFEDVKLSMQSCDIFVLNSRTDPDGDMEGLPNAILEAMAFGKPVVATRHAGIPMAVKHEVTGLLVPERDNDALVSAIRRLIEDVALRQKLGSNGRSFVVEEFSLERMEQRLVTLFTGLGVATKSQKPVLI